MISSIIRQSTLRSTRSLQSSAVRSTRNYATVPPSGPTPGAVSNHITPLIYLKSRFSTSCLPSLNLSDFPRTPIAYLFSSPSTHPLTKEDLESQELETC